VIDTRHDRTRRLNQSTTVIVGTVTARTPGETAKDIPWLKLDVSEARSDVSGSPEEVRTVQRVNTKGGALEGACEKAGDYRPEPYSADYIFLQKPR
jgi:hypothetical protein